MIDGIPLFLYKNKVDGTAGGCRMNHLFIFILRVILAGVFAVILVRVFYPRAGVTWIVGAALALLGLAYVTEYFRIRGRDDN